MSEEHFVKYSRNELPGDKGTDGKRLEAMSEDEINKAAASDPDAQPADPNFWKDAKYTVNEVSWHFRLDDNTRKFALRCTVMPQRKQSLSHFG